MNIMKPRRKGTENLRKLAKIATHYPDLIEDYKKRKRERKEMLDKYGPIARENAKRIIEEYKRRVNNGEC